MLRTKKIVIAALLGMMSGNIYAEEINEGTIHFTGEIIEPSCEISGDGGTHDMNVPLGTYPTSLFDSVGKESTLKPFRITLINCPLKSTGLPAVQLTFTGDTELTGSTSLLDVSQITTTGDTAATGVGIAISPNGNDTNLLKLDGSEGQVSIDLPEADDAIIADFNARYKSFAKEVTAGAADGDLVVNILYR
ncbi:fimbrial protein [Yokenella regensburgei]|uniref:fimbrial protein n=1 Tax=Yokenella regensburgei TaxID=158877 RepID=UPI003EDA73FA